MAKTKAELEEFWKQNDGKLIKGYGKWLIAYGIIVALVCAFWIFYIITQLRGYELTGLGIAVITFYFACICSAIYYTYAGESIVKGKFSPNKIQGASTAVIALVLITAACQVFLTSQLGGATTVVFGIIDIVTLVDSIRYKNHWHKAYQDFYDSNTKTSGKGVSSNEKQKLSRDIVNTKNKNNTIKESEYYDGL